MRALLPALIALGILIPGAPAHAARAAYPASDVVWIDDGEGSNRALLDFGDLSALSGHLVSSARIELRGTPFTPTHDVFLQLRAVDTAWDAGTVSWTRPWTEAGGDTSLDDYRTVKLPAGRGSGALSIDVSAVVREIADGGRANRGFVLMTPPSTRDGLTSTEKTWLGSLSGATLVVRYRKLPAAAQGLGSRFIVEGRKLGR